MVSRGVIERAIEAGAEAVVLNDLAETFVPLVAEAVGGTGTLLFDFGESGRPRALTGSLAPHIASYNATLFGRDPLQVGLRLVDPARSTVMLEDVLGYDELRACAAFQEFYRPLGVERLIGVWPTGKRFGSAGMVGLLVGRTLADRAFGERERRLLERVKPALRAVIARDRRSRIHERERDFLALAVRHVSARPLLVIDARGEIAWRSARALEWARTSTDATAKTRLIVRAARSLMKRKEHGCMATCEARLWLTELHGTPVVVVEVHADRASDGDVFATARRLGLTKAEATVLVRIAHGLDNRSIADDLHISETTVKTHVRQILSKLGLASRTQAALLAHGLVPPRDDR